MKKSKLLIITTSPLTINLILKNQPKYLSQFYDVEIATSPDASFECIFAREKVITHAVSMDRGINLVKDIYSIIKMFFLVKKLKPTIVHSYTPKAGLVAMVSSYFCRVPIRIHTFTGLIFPTQTGFKKILIKNVDKLICLFATHIIPESNGVKKILIKENITKKPLALIGHGNIAGVDVDFFNSDEKNFTKKANGKFRFIFVGRLHRDKGIEELITAFDKIGNKAELVLVGDLDQEGQLNKDVLNRIKSNPSINWVGFQHDIRDFLINSDVLILPSYREGFPNVLLQAGAMALPCLVTDIPGSNEIIEENKNGWIIPPGDHNSLLIAIEKCLSISPSELQTMGQYAKKKIHEKFEQKAHWQRMHIFYEGLLINEKNF